MIDVLSDSQANQQSNILEIIHNCLPVQISSFDGLPKVVCDLCCEKSRNVYEFIQLILTTQKMLLRNLDAVDLMRTNKNKVVQRFAVDAAEKSVKSSDQRKSSSDPVQQVFENLRKTRTNVTISKVKCSKPPETQTFSNVERITVVEMEVESASPQVETVTEHQTSDIEIVNDETNQIIEYYEEYLNDFDQANEELESIEKECESTSPSPSKTPSATSPVVVEPTTSSVEPPATVVELVKSPTKPAVVKMMCDASFVCMTCKINVHTFEELRIHMKTNLACKKINLTCDTCSKVCDSKKSLYQHTLTHKQKYSFVCEDCGKIYTNRFNLENHRSSFHGEQVEEYGSIYKCKICDDQFTNRKELYDHLSNHKKMPSVNLCDTCGKCFDYPEQLRSHVRVHSDHRPFPCTYCDKRFRSRLQQLQHLHVHNGQKQFICMQCDRAFAKRGSLVAHTRLHSGETPYACTECDEKFASPGKLKTHAKYHNTEERPKEDLK
ncbi:Gastrula zinc finger protein XlCGF57.1, partial [Pseudolycoriella hygida]